MTTILSLNSCYASVLNLLIAPLLLFFIAPTFSEQNSTHRPQFSYGTDTASLLILGTLQDAGAPHLGCRKSCCSELFASGRSGGRVVSLGLHDAANDRRYLFEATPDIPRQWEELTAFAATGEQRKVDGIFLTHAHIGHYSGLMHLGKEALDARGVPVYAMPRMRDYLERNGPWSQLVQRGNIALQPMEARQPVELPGGIRVTPLPVPHRDEFSETVGFLIQGPRRKALFIPDIDKWEKWDLDIREQIRNVDYAFVDATFFSSAEVGHRDITQIPHPLVGESMDLLAGLGEAERRKVIFLHVNHTNPLARPGSEAEREVIARGFRVARLHDVFPM